MAVDISGGVFSILSLAFKEKFDVFASITYTVVIASFLSFGTDCVSYSVNYVYRSWICLS